MKQARRVACLLLAGAIAGCTGHIGSPVADTWTPTSPAPSGTVSGKNPSGDRSTTGGTTPAPVMSTGPTCASMRAGPALLRRLTQREYDNTIRDLLGETTDLGHTFPADDRIDGFASNGERAVAELHAEKFLGAAEVLAARAASNLAKLLPCDPAKAEDACARQFVATFGGRAFRRPLPTAEVDAYLKLYQVGKGQGGFVVGVRTVIEAMLQSPHFLYRAELGGARVGSNLVGLTPHEIASRLSYFLWSTMPDQVLFAAAEAGELATREGIAKQVTRMLADPKGAEAIRSFHAQWLEVEELETLDKDDRIYPQFTADIAKAMKRETEELVTQTLLGGEKLEALFTTAASYVDPTLFKYYGLSGKAPAAGQFQRVDLDVRRHAGILTQGSFLAKQARSDQTSPVLRGKFVRERLFCQPPPPPPPDADAAPPVVDSTKSTRERFAAHRSSPECAGCHALMDPIGFGFETFDGIGRYRTMDGGKPVDASGDLVATDVDGAFVGPTELAARIGRSRLVFECYARQWVTYALGREAGGSISCSVEGITRAFTHGGRDLMTLFVATATSDAFRYQLAR